MDSNNNYSHSKLPRNPDYCDFSENNSLCYPKVPCAFLTGIEVQLFGTTTIPIGVASNAPVRFDTLVSSASSSISYNSATGDITIVKTGVYHINWWINYLATDTPPNITFAIVASSGKTIRASTPLSTLSQLTGNALIPVIASPMYPVTVRLVNLNNGTVFFATSTPVKADLTIITVSSDLNDAAGIF